MTEWDRQDTLNKLSKVHETLAHLRLRPHNREIATWSSLGDLSITCLMQELRQQEDWDDEGK